MTIIADIPTNVNHELCPPSQCDASDEGHSQIQVLIETFWPQSQA